MGNKEIGMVKVDGCRCRCGYEWIPEEVGRPQMCPRCLARRWDRAWAADGSDIEEDEKWLCGRNNGLWEEFWVSLREWQTKKERV